MFKRMSSFLLEKTAHELVLINTNETPCATE